MQHSFSLACTGWDWGLVPSICSAGAAVASAIAAWLNFQLSRNRREEELHEKLNEIIKLSLMYPHVEDAVYIDTWPEQWRKYHSKENRKELTEEQCRRLLQYDYFADVVFNLLSHLYSFYKKDKNKIKKIVNVKDWVSLHSRHWEVHMTDYENVDSYDEEFKNYINEYIHEKDSHYHQK